MLQVGFELTIPVFERAKTFHALDYAATMIGLINSNWDCDVFKICIPFRHVFLTPV
jgi:hypothetical protein